MPADHLHSEAKASLVILDKVTWRSYTPEERNLCEHSCSATWASSAKACKVLSSRKCGKCGWMKTGCCTLHHSYRRVGVSARVVSCLCNTLNTTAIPLFIYLFVFISVVLSMFYSMTTYIPHLDPIVRKIFFPSISLSLTVVDGWLWSSLGRD